MTEQMRAKAIEMTPRTEARSLQYFDNQSFIEKNPNKVILSSYLASKEIHFYTIKKERILFLFYYFYYFSLYLL